jgi:NADPH-dependent F420 reductase
MTTSTPSPAAQDAPDLETLTIGVLGGTGDQGRGIALRLATSGLRVVLGSRDAARADEAAKALGHGITGVDNLECARSSDVVIVAVPWDGHRATLEPLAEALAGKVVIDCVNPLGFDKQGAYALTVDEGSAAQQAQAVLADSHVVAAFNNISAVLLLDPDVATIDTDVLVVGDVRAATDLVQSIVERIPGMRGIYAGRLRNAHQVEALTANLISANRRYKAHAGVRITDV